MTPAPRLHWLRRSLTLSVLVFSFAICGFAQNPVFISNYSVDGYLKKMVSGLPVPVSGAPVILSVESLLSNSNGGVYYVYTNSITVITDASGHFGPLTLPCYRSEPWNGWNTNLQGSVRVVAGEGGASFGGGFNCDYPTTITLLPIGSTNEPDLQNAGCDQQTNHPSPNLAHPVNVTTGNMWLTQTDYELPGIGPSIRINRYYNTAFQESGFFGIGWTLEYDEGIANFNNQYLRLRLGSGRAAYLVPATPGSSTFVSASVGFTAQIVKNGDNTFTLTFKDGRVHKFHTNGRLEWQKDRNGNQTTVTYSGSGGTGNLTGVIDAFGRTLTITANTNGTIASISDSLGVIASYEYYPSPDELRLKTVTYQDGSKYKFEYDSTSAPGKVLLKTVKDTLDNILETHLYDSQGRATTSERHGTAEKHTFDYSNPAFTIVTDILGRVTKYHFDRSKGLNVLTKTEGQCGCGSGGSEVTEYFYDIKLNLFKKVDALGRETLYTYDNDRYITQQVDVYGTQKWTYNSFGQVLTYRDRIDSQTQNPVVYTAVMTYDTNGNSTTHSDALGKVTTLEYPATNNKGLPDLLRNARKKVTKFKWFSASGLLQEVEDTRGKKTNFTYDARGRTDTITNALSHVTNFDYFDDTQRKVELVYPNSDKIIYKYDIRRLLESITDERGKVTAYEFDPQQRLKKITDPLAHTKEFGYDLMSNMTSSKDGLGNVTDYVLDDFDRLKEIVYPPASQGATRLKEKFEYDKLGRIKKHFDTANRETIYNYDDPNRTNTVTNTDGEITTIKYNQRFQTFEVKDAINQIYTFSYDPLDRMLSQTRAGGTMSFEYDEVGSRKKRTDYAGRITDYEYDDLNRLTRIKYGGTLLPNSPPNTEATYVYDDISRLTSAVNNAGTVGFTYDNRNRLKTETDVFGHVIEYVYDPASRRTQLKLDGSVHTSYGYDDANRLTGLTDEASQSFLFVYDNADRLTSRTFPNGITSTFEYDGMSRLTKLKHQSATATLVENNFSFNGANQVSQIAELTQAKNFTYDNFDRLTGTTNGTSSESYAYDDVGNRTSSHRSASYGYQPFNKLTSTATANYTYDANGNMLSKSDSSGFWTYGWDFENRIHSARKNNKIVRYQYDALGRRVSRQGKSVGATAKYTYDGLDVVLDDGSEGVVKYQNGLGIDDKLKMVVDGQAKYFLQDHLGSSVGFTNTSGAFSEQISSDSFGNGTNPTFSSRYQYTGREFDPFTGLHSYRARWYDSNLGRFISEDPIGLNGGDINLYAYVGNRPNRFTDPLGLFPSWWWPFDYHQRITRDALAGRATSRDIQSISWANRNFDEQTQDDQYAPAHAMRSVGQGERGARMAANAFVRSKICLAREYESRGWHTYAMHELGAAAHTLQDAESPAHSDFQEAWPNTKAHVVLNLWHYVNEIVFPGTDNIKRAEDNTQRVWDYFNGTPMPQDFFSPSRPDGRSCECPS